MQENHLTPYGEERPREGRAYGDYWARKRRAAEAPRFPVARWWATDGLADIERVYFDAIRHAKSLLEVGAGDLRVRQKLLRAGFQGTYETQDVGDEFVHTYRSIDQVTRRYDAVLCLDVLEHLRLEDGLALLDRVVGLLEPGGVLVVQTPNGRCVRNPLGWDMTHLHLYNLADLWAHLRTLGLDAVGYRIWFAPKRFTPWGWARSTFSRFVTTKVLGCDYADNIGVVARRSGA